MPPKPKPKKRKRPDEVIAPTPREELLMRDCGKLMHRTVDAAISKAKNGLETSLKVFFERELITF